jgi:hypothetical protein
MNRFLRRSTPPSHFGISIRLRGNRFQQSTRRRRQSSAVSPVGPPQLRCSLSFECLKARSRGLLIDTFGQARDANATDELAVNSDGQSAANGVDLGGIHTDDSEVAIRSSLD